MRYSCKPRTCGTSQEDNSLAEWPAGSVSSQNRTYCQWLQTPGSILCALCRISSMYARKKYLQSCQSAHSVCCMCLCVQPMQCLTSTHQHCRKVSKVNGALWPQSCKEGTKKASTHLTKLHQQLREEWLQDEDNNTYSELKAACEGAKKARLPYDGKLDSSLWPADWVSDPHWCICTLHNSHCAPTNVHRPRRRQSCHRRRWWP
jgi:hypothetical protein